MDKYTVDRIEGNVAVLLKKGKESVKKDVPIEYFPQAIKDGDIVKETNTSGGIRYTILDRETEIQRQKADELLNRLKRKQ